MTESKTKEAAPSSTTATHNQESTASTTAGEEMKKEFSRNNQHNQPRNKREVEPTPRHRFSTANKKDYQRTRGRNKR